MLEAQGTTEGFLKIKFKKCSLSLLVGSVSLKTWHKIHKNVLKLDNVKAEHVHNIRMYQIKF